MSAATRRCTAALVGLVVTLVVVLGLAAPAWAHAELESVEPATGTTLEDPPAQVVLRFSGAVDPVAGEIRVVSGDGAEVSGVEVGRVDGDTSTIAVDLPADLPDAAYVVAWRVVAADSHLLRGASTFTAGDTGPRIEPALVERLLTGSGGGRTGGAVLAVGRWASYVGLALALGVAALVLRGLGDPAGAVDRRLVRGGAVVAAVGTLVMIAGQAAVTASGAGSLVDPGAWADVVSTRAGGWWAVRALLMVGLALGASTTVLSRLAGRGSRPGAGTTAVAVAAAVAVLLVVSLGGHGATGRAPLVGLAATVVHLGAMSVWVGGLVLVAAVAWRHGRAAALGLARRFSPVALLAVVVLAATGLVNSWRQVGDIELLTSTDYGRVLLVKLAFVALAVGVALFSRRLVRRGSGTSVTGSAVGASVAGELVWIVAVLVSTVLLVNVRPAVAERAEPVTATVVTGERTAQVTLDPARTGGAAMHVYLFSTSGTLDRAQDITVRATLAERDIGPLVLPLVPAGPNHVTAPAVDLPLPGLWTIEVAARYGDFDQATFDMEMRVR